MRHRMFGEKACLQESGALLLSAPGALPGGAKESTFRRRIPPQAPPGARRPPHSERGKR